MYDVAVVGAGMFGAAAAKYLARQGASVLIVGPAEPAFKAEQDQRTFGAHYDEARITRRLGWDEVWSNTDAHSMNRFRSIEQESGIEFFYDRGSLVLMAGSIAHRTDAMLAQSRAEDIEVERLSEGALAASFPALGKLPLSGGVEGLMERAQSGYLNPRRLVAAQLALAEAAGGELRRSAVHAIKAVPGKGWRLHLNGQAGADQVQARRVLLATGAFTNHNNVLPPHMKLAMHAFGEPNLVFEVNPTDLQRFGNLPPIVVVDPENNGDDNMSIYFLPPTRYPCGSWYARIGPGMQPFVTELRNVSEMTEWCRNQAVTDRQATCLSRMTRQLLPDFEPLSVRQACCIIEKTPSRYPYIGPVSDDESLFVVVGGNGHGARGSDEIGRLAASVTLDARWDSSLSRSIFAPIFAGEEKGEEQERPEFLKPPFGLC